MSQNNKKSCCSCFMHNMLNKNTIYETLFGAAALMMTRGDNFFLLHAPTVPTTTFVSDFVHRHCQTEKLRVEL